MQRRGKKQARAGHKSARHSFYASWQEHSHWGRPLAGKPMPAFFATTHWEGSPSMESLACFTSLYSCWPAWE